MSSSKAGSGQPPAYTPRSGQPPLAGNSPQTANSLQAGVNGQNTSTVIVTQPRHIGIVGSYPTHRDYLVPSIIACLCCCFPIGICAIIFAAQANSAAARGDMADATRLSNTARNLMITSIVIGVSWIIFIIIFYAVL